MSLSRRRFTREFKLAALGRLQMGSSVAEEARAFDPAHHLGISQLRVTAELKGQGGAVNHKRVYRLMREDNLLCLRRRKFVPAPYCPPAEFERSLARLSRPTEVVISNSARLPLLSSCDGTVRSRPGRSADQHRSLDRGVQSRSASSRSLQSHPAGLLGFQSRTKFRGPDCLV
jgi:transposase InsO family protein